VPVLRRSLSGCREIVAGAIAIIAGSSTSVPERKSVVEFIVSKSPPALERYSDGSALAFQLRANLATAKG
jgi:hypothetical protein